MNREHKKRLFEKGYYKTHPCNNTFICKFCGKTVVPTGAGSNHRNHCPYCLSSQHLDNEPGDRSADCGGVMEPVSVWVRKKANGRSFIGAGYVERSTQTVSPLMITP